MDEQLVLPRDVPKLYLNSLKTTVRLHRSGLCNRSLRVSTVCTCNVVIYLYRLRVACIRQEVTAIVFIVACCKQLTDKGQFNYITEGSHSTLRNETVLARVQDTLCFLLCAIAEIINAPAAYCSVARQSWFTVAIISLSFEDSRNFIKQPKQNLFGRLSSFMTQIIINTVIRHKAEHIKNKV